ncbi:F0F1 ATP synthase subunit alpha [bacterium]|jgi:F-type H+/Na+-transporting ATPase subunit alpha|nr:F0F1 ATP synthase subunit alpha [bacterium]MBT6293685.1 F0F1 ATP synthase subunit alpha [bacterium]
MSKSLNNLLDQLSSALESIESSSKRDGVGVVESFKDGVISVTGLKDVRMSEILKIEGTDVQALVMNLDPERIFALVLQRSLEVTEGSTVTTTGRYLSIPVSKDVFGRVVNPLGQPLDGKSKIKKDEYMPLEANAPDVMARKSVHEPVQTGILAIDAMVPIGRGQRELIIGDRQTGKTQVALDTIINQKGKDMYCVYVSIGQREGKLAQVIETLRNKGAMDYTTVVSAPASDSAVMQYLAPYAGCAIAEYFMKQGKHVIVVYDDLSKHAVSYREMSLLLRRPPGREAYPGDVFYLHSRLLERAAKLNDSLKGGSITALPIIETQAGDISAYIPTNVISITDGQIFLKTDLFNKGVRPAIDAGNSVSRVGGSAQTHIVKKLSGTVKLSLAQYYELEAFSQFASELDQTTLDQLNRGRRVVELLKQNQNSPLSVAQEAISLLALSQGYLDKVEIENVTEKIQALHGFLESNHSDLYKTINRDAKLTDEVKASLIEALNNFFN